MARFEVGVIFRLAVFGIFSVGVALAQDAPPSKPDIPAGDILGVGWLKTFPYEPTDVPDGATIVIPEVYETVLETEIRARLAADLAERGFRIVASADEAGTDAFVLSVNAKVANEFEAEPPQSPLRFAAPLNDPARDDRFRTITPPPLSVDRGDFLQYDPVYWDDYIENKKDHRSVSLNVYLHQAGKRIWGGFAAAGIGPKGRSVLARAMASEIAGNLGGVAAREPAVFVADPSDGTAPAVEIR